MKKTLKISFVIIGTIIGAGFASGKEIYVFFCSYGFLGLLGLIFSNFFMGSIIYISFKIISDNNIKTNFEFIKFLVGNNKLLNFTINNIITVFLFISFVIMVAGFGAFFSQEFNVPIFLGAIIISFLSFAVFSSNIKCILNINSFLIPFLILLIVLLGVKCDLFFLNFKHIICSLNYTKSICWILHSILYASYNSIVLIPIIINLNNILNNKNQIKYIALFTFIFLILMSLIIFFVLNIHINEIKNIDIPMIFIAKKFGIFFKYLYGFALLSAIFTTAISAGFSLLKNVSYNKKSYKYFSFFLCFISIILSNFGFSYLLNLLYPILGYIGLIQIIIMFFRYSLYFFKKY